MALLHGRKPSGSGYFPWTKRRISTLEKEELPPAATVVPLLSWGLLISRLKRHGNTQLKHAAVVLIVVVIVVLIVAVVVVALI